MLDKLKEILSGINPDINAEEVTRETRLFDDLHLDSLSIMLFAMEIEAAFDFKFTEALKFTTVGDVCDYIESRTK